MEMYEDAYVFPVVPNWRTPVEGEWSYKTDIFKTRSGNESRRANREKPRRTLSFDVLLAREEAEYFRYRLAKAAGRKMVIADAVKRIEGLFPSSATISSVAMVQVPYWIRTGMPVAIVTGKSVQVRKVISTIDDVVVFASSVTVEPWSHLSPAIIGRVAAEQPVGKPNDSVVTASIDFNEDPTTALDPLDPLLPLETGLHREFPVMAFKPNWRSPITERFVGAVDIVDYDYGSITVFHPEAEARWVASFNCLARNSTESQAALDFFFRRKGRRGSFYCPTWQSDLTVLSGFATDSTTLVARGTMAHDLFSESLVYRNLALLTEAGIVPIGIKSTEPVGDTTQITLDAPLPANMGALLQCSWLLMVRYASDQFAMSWHNDQVAEFDVSLSALFDQFYEFTIAGARVTFGGDYMVFPPFSRRETPIIPITIGGELILFSGDFFA